jgi:hypothetical protein
MTVSEANAQTILYVDHDESSRSAFAASRMDGKDITRSHEAATLKIV